MDIYKEFKTFCEGHNLSVQEALGKIAVIRSFRPDTMRPEYKDPTRKKQTRSDSYLRFIKNTPCIGCGRKIKDVEAVLFNDEGKDVKKRASDYSALPLCKFCKKDKKIILSIKPRLHYLQSKMLQTYLRFIEGTWILRYNATGG